jgi:hypothetical protein
MSDFEQRQREELYQRQLGQQGISTGSMHNKYGLDDHKSSMNPSPGYGSCFASETPVLTPCGWRPIASIEPGDFVRSYDRSTGTMADRRVIQRQDHRPTRIWEVRTNRSSRPIETTVMHPFLTQRGWVAASKLRAGDTLVAGSGAAAEVRSVWRTDRSGAVHNLVTEGEHTYVVAGCVVHNYAYAPALRTWWARLISKLFSDTLETRQPELGQVG